MKAVVNSQAFKKMIKKVEFSVGENSVISCKQYIFLEINKEAGYIKACAINGIQLSIAHAKLTSATESFSCYITSKIPEITRLSPSIEIESELTKQDVCISLHNILYRYPQPDLNNLDFDHSIVMEEALKRASDPQYKEAFFLGDYLRKSFLTVEKLQTVSVKVLGEKQPIVISSKTESGLPDDIQMISPVIVK